MPKVSRIAAGFLATALAGTSAFAVDWQQALNDATILQGEHIEAVGNGYFYASVSGSGSTGVQRDTLGSYTLGDGRYVIHPDGEVTSCDGNMAECTAILKDAAEGSEAETQVAPMNQRDLATLRRLSIRIAGRQ